MDIQDNNPQEMQNPFEEIKVTDSEGREWWNSRQLAHVLGYGKYWNFERLTEKVSDYLQRDKGLKLNEHIVETGEIHLSECFKKILNPSDNSSADGIYVYNLDVVIAA